MSEETITVEYLERVRHIYCHFSTNDEELAWAETITDEKAERIDIVTTTDEETGPIATEVIVSTEASVYHFNSFRSYYTGHGSRTLIALLAHFGIIIPIDFLVELKAFTIYVDGTKIVDLSGTEYSLGWRDGFYYLVESVNWTLKSETIDIVIAWADKYGISPEEVVEQSISLLIDKGMGQVALEESSESENEEFKEVNIEQTKTPTH